MATAVEPGDQTGAGDKQFLSYSGPRPGVSYPVKAQYCGECTMPTEYCEYYPNYEKCKKWLETHLPEQFEKLMAEKGEGDGDVEKEEEKKKRQTRGGKGAVKVKKKSEPQGIKLATAKRGRKKITIVMGLASYDIDLKEASKFFSNRFSCGSSVQGEDEIGIQGDVKDDLYDIIPEKWKIVNEDDIDDIGEMKK